MYHSHFEESVVCRQCMICYRMMRCLILLFATDSFAPSTFSSIGYFVYFMFHSWKGCRFKLIQHSYEVWLLYETMLSKMYSLSFIVSLSRSSFLTVFSLQSTVSSRSPVVCRGGYQVHRFQRPIHYVSNNSWSKCDSLSNSKNIPAIDQVQHSFPSAVIEENKGLWSISGNAESSFLSKFNRFLFGWRESIFKNSQSGQLYERCFLELVNRFEIGWKWTVA